MFLHKVGLVQWLFGRAVCSQPVSYPSHLSSSHGKGCHFSCSPSYDMSGWLGDLHPTCLARVSCCQTGMSTFIEKNHSQIWDPKYETTSIFSLDLISLELYSKQVVCRNHNPPFYSVFTVLNASHLKYDIMSWDLYLSPWQYCKCHKMIIMCGPWRFYFWFIKMME